MRLMPGKHGIPRISYEGGGKRRAGGRWGSRKKARVFAKTGGMCMYRCGRPATTIEHIRPVSQGGTNDDANLGGACLECNLARGTMPADSFRPRTVDGPGDEEEDGIGPA